MTVKSTLIIFLLSMVTSFGYNQILEGTISDEFGPLMQAEIKIAGTNKGTLSDMEGHFQLKISPNQEVDIIISYTFYEDFTIKKLRLKENENRTFSINMVMEGGTPPVIDGNPDTGTSNVMLAQQANSSKTFNGTTAQEIAKTGDVNAAAAVKRISGVNIEEGKYVYVRGLGDRYTTTQLNGLNIPGLDPDRNSIQLDIFPANIIKNIKVYKSFSPDLPGDFTGGLVDITTQDFPEKGFFDISGGVGFNPSMHFNKNYISYSGGKRDWIAMDDGTRKLPLAPQTIIPDEAIAGNELTN
ncbi:MAG: carboxypeptidase-like regulatory domain-containing protein, partial [Flavobacteriales bacterium]|nr:carboxypeptidase-like regulatory domain-containing protein [Flavobacteriales bacterium]